MHTNKLKVRFWVVAPFLLYFVVFLLWFPRWQHAPDSPSARLLGLVFGGMTAVLALSWIIGWFVLPAPFGSGLGRLVKVAIDAYETFLKRDASGKSTVRPQDTGGFATLNHPTFVITHRLKDGTPVRGACPLCHVEFSTEAFEHDRAYPHEGTLNKWYEEHFASHISERNAEDN